VLIVGFILLNNRVYAKIKFLQPSHYEINITATLRQSQGGCDIFYGEFSGDILFPEIARFDAGLMFGGVIFQEVGVGDRS
jgi:hypothetical protein